MLYQPSLSRWSLGSAVVDTTRRIGAGLSYNYGTIGGEDRSSHDARLALSVALERTRRVLEATRELQRLMAGEATGG